MTALAELDQTGSRILVKSDLRDKELVKLVPGHRWDHDARVWHYPASWGTCKALRGVFGTDLQVGPRLTRWAIDDKTRRIDPCLALRGSVDAPGWGPEGLRDDQRVGVAMLITGVHVLLGDDMGTGKTVMGASALDLALTTLDARAAGPALVVCPNTVKRGWQRECAKWAPGLRVAALRGAAKKRREILDAVKAGEYDVLVVNWEMLRMHSRLAPYGSTRLETCQACDPESTRKPASCHRCPKELNEIAWSVVIADEVHRAKDPKSQQTRALWAVGHQPSVRYRWGLTGTAIANAMDDLWSIMHFIAPDEYPTKTAYIDRYALTSWNAFGGLTVVGIKPETRDEFFSVFDPRFLRRPRSYSLAHVKDPQRRIHWVEMGAKQAKAYAEMEAEMVARLEGGDTVVATNPLTVTTRLNQFAASMMEKRDCGPCGTTGLRPTDADPMAKCPKCNGRGFIFVVVDPSCKIGGMFEVIDELNDDEQFVVFAVSKQLIDLAAHHLANPPKGRKPVAVGVISGDVTEAQRYDRIDEFRAGTLRALAVVIDAGGEGLDGMQCAQVGIFLQRHYSRLKNVQAEGRLVRGGQEGQTVFVDIRTEGTIEDDKEALLAEKEGRFEELVRDREQLMRLLTARQAA